MNTLSVKELAAKTGAAINSIQIACREGRIPGAYHTNPENPRRGEWLIPADTDWKPRTYPRPLKLGG
jgi:hypothetical protein